MTDKNGIKKIFTYFRGLIASMRGLYLVVGLVLTIHSALAQTITSAGSGPWNSTSTWVGGVIPTSANSTLVQIASTHAVTIPAGYNATAVSVTLAPAGATNCSLTIGDALTGTGSLTYTGTLTYGGGPVTRGRVFVNGLLGVEQGAVMAGGIGTAGRLTVNATGTYRHNYTTTAGIIYTATWQAGSTLEIAGYTTNTTSPTGLGQAFSNFTWNCPNQQFDIYLDGSLVNVGANFSVLAPSQIIFGLTTNTPYTLTIGGNLTLAQDVFLDLTGGTGNAIVNLRGNLTINSDDGIGNFGSGTAAINFRGSSPQTLTAANLISSLVDFEVFTNSTLNIPETSYLEAGGNFTLQSGATLGVASIDGLAIGQSAGNIRNYGTRTYTAGGNIVYNGSNAQDLGDEWGPSGQLDGVAVNLEINNTSVGGVTNNIIGSTSLVGRLRLTRGALNIGNSNTLIISGDFDGFSNPTRVGTVSGDASNTSNLTFSGSGTVTGTLNLTTGASTLRNLTIDRADDIYLGTNLTVATAGTLSFASSGNLRINGQTLTINGNITQVGSGAIASSVNTSNLVIGGSGVLTTLPLCTSCPFTNLFNNVTLGRTGGASYTWASAGNVSGILDLTSGSFTHSSGLTMETGSTFRRSAGTTYSGSTPNATTRYNLAYVGNVTSSNELPTTAQNRLENLTVAGNVSLDKSVTINGDLNITSGTLTVGAHDVTMLGATFAANGGSFSINAANTVTFSRAGTTAISGSTINDAQFGNFTISNGTTVSAPNFNINIAGTWDNSSGGTFTANTGTVTFNGGAQDVDAAGQSFFNFATSGGVKTLVGALDVNGQLTIGTGSTLSADTYTINVAGAWQNSGTFSAGTGTVVFDGTTQSINSVGQSFNNVTIANSGTKSLAAPIDVNGNLAINSGATLDVSSSNHAVNVAKNFTNNGTLNPRSGTVFFDGSTIQTIAGTTNTVFNNITTSNSSTVIFSTDQSIAGVLTLNQGIFNPNGHFTLLSSATRDARIAQLGATASIAATNMTIQRYLPNTSSSTVYRYLSSPVLNGNVAGWKDNFPITGTFNDPSTTVQWPAFPTMNVNGPSLFWYNEAHTPSTTIDDRYESFPPNGFSSTSSPQATLVNGRGYAAFVRQNSAITIDLVGSAAYGPRTIAVTNTAGGTNDGWNLIGNPYPAPINWDNVTRPGQVQAQIALKDNTNNIGLGAGQYIYYTQNGVGIPASYTGTIAQGQAFWVRNTSSTSSANITFQEDDKQAINAPAFLRDADQDLLRVRLNSATRQDELVIHFQENASDGADVEYDAFKLKNDFINFSSLSTDGKEMAINTFSPLTCSREVPLVVKQVTAGSHVMTFESLSTFNQGISFLLMDTFTGTSTSITNDSNTYSFDVTSDPASFGANRFKVFIGYPATNLGAQVVAQDVCVGAVATLTVVEPDPGVTYFATLNGTTISGEAVALTGSDLNLTINKGSLQAGENIIMVMTKVGACAAAPLSQSVKLNVENIPVAPTATTALNCGPGQLILTAAGMPEGGSYRWYDAADAINPIDGESGASFLTPTLTKTKTYYVSAVNAIGCEGARTAVEARISYAYDIAGVTNAQVCAGSSATLSATGAPTDGSYRWYVSEQSVEAIPGQTTGTFVTNPLNQDAIFFVAAVNSNGCEGQRIAVTAQVVMVPTPTITADGAVLTSSADLGNQWYLNGSLIAGATGKTYEPKESGVYKVVVTNGNCTASAEQSYSVTGDIEFNSSKGYLAYPNPTQGVVYFEVDTQEPVRVVMRSQLGVELAVADLRLDGGVRKGEVDISLYANGLYFAAISHGEKTVLRKILKK